MEPIKTAQEQFDEELYNKCLSKTMAEPGKCFVYSESMVSHRRAAELYVQEKLAQFRTERLTNNQIDAMWPLHNSSGDYLQYNAARREAARTVRDLIQGGENE